MSARDLTQTAEFACAAAIVVDGLSALASIRAEIKPEDFSQAIPRAVMEAACAAVDSGRDLSKIEIAGAIDTLGLTEAVGGLAGLDRLCQEHRPGEVEPMVERVAKAATIRRLGQRMRKLADYSDKAVAVDNDDRFLAAVSSIADDARSRVRRGTVNAAKACMITMQALMDRGKVRPASPTPISQLNELMGGGLVPERMIVIGARPGFGKSALAAQSIFLGASLGHPQLVFSLEMPIKDIVGRGVVQRRNLDNTRWDRATGPGGLSEGDMMSVIADMKRMAEMPFEIDDNEHELGAMLARALVWLHAVARPHIKRMADEGTPGLVPVVWIDYLQRCTLAGKHASREERTGEMSRRIAQFAREQNCAVGVVAMLNRSSKKENRWPRIDDLRDSGAIEQDANQIILLHRDAGATGGSDHAGAKIVEADALAILDKNRHGPVAVVPAIWNGPSGKFKNPPEGYIPEMMRPRESDAQARGKGR